MKKNVIVFGLIAGLIVSTLMVLSMARCYSDPNLEHSMLIGYASMVLAFSFIFVGIKNYRDKYNDGLITFGKAFKIGALISLVASTIYVIVWLIDYYVFMPDFMDRYVAQVLREAKAGGASAAELAKKTTELVSSQEMYKNPIMVVLFTYMEILPVGILISLVAALILKRKQGAPLSAKTA
jgi:ethanolamine transporter EutH